MQLFVAALGASRSGITKACFYEPTVNRSYAEMAAHYNTAVVPARPYRARDKANISAKRREAPLPND